MNKNILMEFKTDFTFNDFLGLCLIKVNKLIYFIIAAVSAAFCATLYPRISGSIWLLAVIVFVVIVCGVYLMRLYVKKRAKSVFQRNKVSNVLHLTLDDGGINQKSEYSETYLAWEDVYRVRENKDCFFVFLNKNTAFYFPKRSFESSETRKRFTEIIIDKVSPSKVFFR
jgi:hypothetical protein